jgi:precorrin-6Y C5,15-methyltransferase (decarboxylating)
MKARAAVTVVGIGDDGCGGLCARAFNAVARAQVLVGGERQLAFFPSFGGRRIVLQGGLSEALTSIEELAAEHDVCVLASGDPLFYGIGGLIVKRLGAGHVEFIPQPSSVQWAFAKVGRKWDDAEVISLHGRPLAGLLTRLRRLRKVACLTDADNAPQRIATLLFEAGDEGWDAWVCENLCGPEERVRRFTIAELAACTDIGPLNVLLLERRDAAWREPPLLPFLPEEAYAKRMPKLGLITKREVRLLSLAQLGLRPDSVVWDVGAGSGSVAIEAAMLAAQGRVYAVECDPEGVEICGENIRAHGVDNVRVIAGRAPEALEPLEAPDAVFVGGSKGSMQPILNACYARLRPGGRLVVNAVTLDNVSEAYAAFRALDLWPELIVLNASRGAPLAGKYLRYEALNPIHIFAVEKSETA